jgi:uncharacterized protein YndB with AHSA1/START domain
MKKLHFETKINAPVKKVWHTMLDDQTYREWTKAFGNPGYFEGSWDKGSDIRFIGPEEDGTVSGMISKIADNRMYEFISIKHIGMIMHGVEDTTSDEIKKMGDAYENYTFSEENGVTTVKVDLDVMDDWADMFNEMWPKGLEKLKEMAEK